MKSSYRAQYELRYYADEVDHKPFIEWLETLKDRKVRQAVDRRLRRVMLGNFGDCKPVREGVWELRIDLGAGWRVYYAIESNTVVLLLCGGNKRTQSMDIEHACMYWQDWQQMNLKKEQNNER